MDFTCVSKTELAGFAYRLKVYSKGKRNEWKVDC